MDLGLDGSVALVGGASAGIGLAVAERLAQEGCRVVLFARRQDRLDEAVQRIGGDRAAGVAGDATVPDDLERAVATAVDRFGRLDVLVNNTGGPPTGRFDDLDDDAWRQAFNLTLLSALRLTRHALPHLRKSGRGRVVNVGSMVTERVNPKLTLSSALRRAVSGWAETLALEEAANGVTVNTIATGLIDTDRQKSLLEQTGDPEGARRQAEQNVPVGRIGAPEEMAAAVAFLCSIQAAYITGTTLPVDGGLLVKS